MINFEKDYAAFIEIVRGHQSFVLTTHVNPDGDALGSEIGLAEWLLSIGKDVRIVNHSATPYNFLFLDRSVPIVEQFDEKKHPDAIRATEVIIVLDVNDPGRTRSVGTFLTERRPGQVITVIDHHLAPKEFADSYFVDTEATSTGELVFRLIAEAQPILGGEITKKAAVALYAAIMTDTGSFKFPRTTSTVFRQCAELLDLGADPVMIYNEIYNTSPKGRLALIRDALNSMELLYNDRMALQYILQSQLEAAGANEEDVDGLVQTPFQVKGIVLSVFLLELKEGWKVSTRSKDDVSAADFARTFGGNGHFHAAGARVYESRSLDEMKQAITGNAKPILMAGGMLA